MEQPRPKFRNVSKHVSVAIVASKRKIVLASEIVGNTYGRLVALEVIKGHKSGNIAPIDALV